MTVRLSVDPGLRLAIVRTDGEATGRHVADVIAAQVRARPELCGWDWIHELTGASGEVSQDDVQRIADAFRGRPPDRDVVTVFITFDSAFGLWARTMDRLFARRRHLAARSLEGAVALIQAARRPARADLAPSPEPDRGTAARERR